MSLHYLLDGYNIIHKMPSLPAKLEDQRRLLISFVEQVCPHGSLKNSVTIVFDGQSGIASPLESSFVKVVFSSSGQTADDKIKALVNDFKNRRLIVVVSDDRSIQYAVRALGAKVLTVKAFLDSGKKVVNVKKIQLKEDIKVSSSDAAKINNELKNVWLKRDKH